VILSPGVFLFGYLIFFFLYSFGSYPASANSGDSADIWTIYEKVVGMFKSI
jgi:hypothetical protein